MKWLKRISIWIIVSLSLQCLGLFYLDHYFLATDSKVVTKKVVENQSNKSKNVDIKVPEKANNILVSYDAKYLSYNEDENLKIVNCRDGKIKNIDAEDGSKISFSEWLPDRNRMLLVEKKSNDDSSNLVLYSYDVLKGEKLKVKDLAWGGTKPEVEDIQLSTLTGVTYVNVSNNGKKSNIYRIDRMGDITKINTIPSFVSNIALVRHEDKLVYEGLIYNKIYAAGSQEPISINGVEKLTLIGTDNDDNVYVGELKDNLVSKVYYGKTSENTDQWKVFDLKKPTGKKDLFVSSGGKVYQNDALKGVITEINSGTQTSYVGQLSQLYTKGVVSIVNNKVSFVPFK
ncbi:MAG TPA: hypothetical protein VIM42_10155 [Clostridium sp.]